jgi:hypothetical protein
MSGQSLAKHGLPLRVFEGFASLRGDIESHFTAQREGWGLTDVEEGCRSPEEPLHLGQDTSGTSEDFGDCGGGRGGLR